MTLPELLDYLDARGVRLSLRLVVDAPRGVLSEEVKSALATYKPLLLLRLAQEAQDATAADLIQARRGPVGDDSAPQQALQPWTDPNLDPAERAALRQILDDPWPTESLAESIALARAHNDAILGAGDRRSAAPSPPSSSTDRTPTAAARRWST
jgi:hypothetical protein